MTEVSIAAIRDKISKNAHLFQGLSPEEQSKKLQELLTPEEVRFLQEQQATQNCIFCRIASGEVPTAKIYEDDSFVAFFDINPANPGHAIVITKAHISVLPQVPDELDANLFKLVKVVTSAVYEATGAKGINILQNNGSLAGQVLPHFYIHIIPRFENDGLSFTWQPKKVDDAKKEEIQTKVISLAKDIALEKQKKVYDMSGKELSNEEVEQLEKPAEPKQIADEKKPVEIRKRVTKKRVP